MKNSRVTRQWILIPSASWCAKGETFKRPAGISVLLHTTFRHVSFHLFPFLPTLPQTVSLFTWALKVWRKLCLIYFDGFTLLPIRLHLELTKTSRRNLFDWVIWRPIINSDLLKLEVLLWPATHLLVAAYIKDKRRKHSLFTCLLLLLSSLRLCN